MSERSVFFDEWISSLREQYKYVLRQNDRITLPSLTQVMQRVGFSDDELRQLRLEATMHVDDVGADYAADMNILGAASAHPAECACPQCIPIDSSQFDADGQPLAQDDPEKSSHDSGHLFAAAPLAGTEQGPPTLDDSFSDSTQANGAADGSADADDADDADDETDDPDEPQQIGLF